MPPASAGASAAASAGRAREHLLDLLGPVVADAGYDLEDVTVSSAGRRSLVRVTVDADGGIDLDAVSLVSRLVSDALDADGNRPDSPPALAGAYVLEVSSPGVDRPLTEPRPFRRPLGHLAARRPPAARAAALAAGGRPARAGGARRPSGHRPGHRH